MSGRSLPLEEAMKVIRAKKYGFCSGVRVADLKVRRFAAQGGRGAILGQVVHNERVVEDLEKLGVKTVHNLEEVREPVVVFSAHGVPPSYHERARTLGLEILDTTCKFVYDIHREARRALEVGAHLVFVGDPRHREVVGYTRDLDPSTYHIVQSLEQAREISWEAYPSLRILYQTTLNAEDFEDVVTHIESRNPNTRRADTICYATKQNQDAARELAKDPSVGAVVVIGGKQSANTRHLFEICSRIKPSVLVQGKEDLDPAWLAGFSVVGLTAGASTPDYVIDEVEQALLSLG